MTDRTNFPLEHPEEQLAPYAEGTATPAERERVETHLADCSQCRDELELARSARAAVAALPELDSPGFDVGLVRDAARRDTMKSPKERRVVGLTARTLRPRTGSRRGVVVTRLAWAGVAAAATIVAAVLFVGPITSGGGGAAQTMAAAPREAGPELRRIENYDPRKLQQLAAALTDERGTATQTAHKPEPSPVMGRADYSTAAIVGCLRRAGAVPPNAPVEYADAASFQNQPAFIGAFRTTPQAGSRGALVVLAATRESCQPLYLLRQAL